MKRKSSLGQVTLALLCRSAIHRGSTGDFGRPGSLVHDLAKGTSVMLIIEGDRTGIACIENSHDNGATTVGASVLSEVVTAGELLATLVALKWLVLGVERAVVTLKVFLTTKATRAQSADEGLRGVLSQRLLAAPAVDRDGSRLGVIN